MNPRKELHLRMGRLISVLALALPNLPRRAALLGTSIRRLLHRGARNRISKMLAKVRPEDVAIMLQTFTPGEQAAVFQILIADHTEAAGDVLLELQPQARLAILEGLGPEEVGRLLELAAVDDAVSLLDALPPELREQVLQIVDAEERFNEVQQRLLYADDTAGRIMDSEFVALPETTAVRDAIERVRQIARDVEMISYLYVVDQAGRLIGVTPLRQLLLADPEATLGEIMVSALIKVDTGTDQEEVAELAARYDLLAIPVTDDGGVLVGIVTIDDIVDVVKDEANEDFFKMAGTSEDELVYQDRSFKVAGLRLPWLLFNLVGLLVVGFMTERLQTSEVLAARFEDRAFQFAVMVSFIPVVMGMSGNIGSQTSTIAVRGLATGRVGFGDGRFRRFLWQQCKVGAVLATACSAVVATVAVTWGRDPFLGLVVGLSLFATVQMASITGVLIPVIFERIGFDPAVASGPLVATANDLLGVATYFVLTTASFRVLGL